MKSISRNWTIFTGKPNVRISAHFRGKITNSMARIKIQWVTEYCGPRHQL